MPLEQYGLLKIFNLVYRKNKNLIESLDEHVLTYIKKDMLLSQFSFIGEALPLEGDVDVHDLSNIGPVQTGYSWLNGRYPLPLRPSMNYLVLYSIVECLKLYGIQTWGDCLSRKRGSCFKQPPAQYFSIYSATDLRLDFSVDTNLLDIIEIEHGFSNLKKFLSAGVLQLLSEDIEEHGASLVRDLYLSQESLDAAKRCLTFRGSDTGT
jgi:hypothetical protein